MRHPNIIGVLADLWRRMDAAFDAELVKPQLALFVPVCLLVAGYTRIFAAWIIPTALMGLIAPIFHRSSGNPSAIS